MNDGPAIPMSPGTVLDGRYRLEVLLSEHDGARFWRATDTVLARNVAVHVVASSDPRAPAVLEAARRSAGISEPHLLRVLDCDDVNGVTWVINEWGEGVSLDVMLVQGPLPPMRAAWLTREVAEAIAAAHAKGLYHGRLNPEAVLVTDSGSVKLIGFVVNAAFERSANATTRYGAISPREADVIDLAGILYAALTGRWPGVAPSALPPAPREGARPLRPRQVRAGVPRDLDAICDRVLHKEASQHVLPIETAHEIAAALSDFVGDPAAVAPVDVPSMHDEPSVPVPVETETGLTPIVDLAEAPMEAPTEAPAEAATEAPVVDLAEAAPAASVPADDDAPGESADAAPADDDPDATMLSAPPYSPSGLEIEPEDWEPAAPPPPFEQAVAKPLFAEQERRVPPGSPPASPPPGDQGSSFWPFEDEPGEPRYDEPEPHGHRTWLRNTLIGLMVIALAVAMYVAFNIGRDGDKPTAKPTTTPTSAPPTPVVTGAPVRIVASGDFDPEGDPPVENPGQVPRATDGNPATAWKTQVYRSDARLGGIKSGVGLVLDLGAEHDVTSVQVTLIGEPTDLELYGTAPGVNDPPVELADARRLAGLTDADTSALFRLDPGVRTRYLVIWLTKLPAVGNGFQGQIAEITVRS